MNRLTIRNSDGSISQPTHSTFERVFDKLAAYEDTGLEPEEVKEAIAKLREYEQAEADERLVKLPCKIGDKVYCITIANKKIVEDTVEDFFVWSMKDGELYFRIKLANWQNYVFGIFGKTIFLTREEAERALSDG